MLTVALMLSGPHRLAMLQTAFDSIPIESDAVSEVIVRHQGGPWNWGGELRERILAHPKVRLVEFSDRADWGDSFNRTLDAVQTPWALLLPDDDFLIRPVAKACFEAALFHAQGCGYVSLDWYYLIRERYLPTRPFRPSLSATVRNTPKFMTTMLNLEHVRSIGGFRNLGGFIDTMLFGRLAYEFDALMIDARAGVYRLHGGQESARLEQVYGAHLETVSKQLGAFARSEAEREEFDRTLRSYVYPPKPGLRQSIRQSAHELSQDLRTVRAPDTHVGKLKMRRWSQG